MTYIYQGEQVILPTGSDPTIERVPGHHRYHIGLDLGQHDPTAIVIIEDKQLPEWASPVQQRLGDRRRCVVYADRVIDTRYPDIAHHAASLTQRSPIAQRWTLTVDATGVGRAFCDVLDEWQLEHTRVQMTGGMAARRQGRFWNVSKNLLITDLASAIETQHLTIAGDLPLRTEFIRELESFQIKFTAAGNQVLDAGGAGHHADMAIACALAWFRSEQASQAIGVGQLVGWY